MEAYGETITVLRCNQSYPGMLILNDKYSSKSPCEKKFVIILEKVGYTHLAGFLYNG